MRTIRLVLFSIFGLIGSIFFLIGAIFLSKRQSRKLTLLLEEVVDTLENWKAKPMTVEDKIFLQDSHLLQNMFERGKNKDLTIECSVCGEVTPRGIYYRRKSDKPDSSLPYNFICKDCFEGLPADEAEYFEMVLS